MRDCLTHAMVAASASSHAARGQSPLHFRSYSCALQGWHLENNPHSIRDVFCLRRQTLGEKLPSSIERRRTQTILRSMLAAAVCSGWCRVRPQPEGVREISMQKQSQGNDSGNFFEGQVCVLHVSFRMHHTIGRNQHFSVPRSVQQLVSVDLQMPVQYTSSHYHTGARWFSCRVGMVVLWTAARRAAAASADAQGKCRAHKVKAISAVFLVNFTRVQRVTI